MFYSIYTVRSGALAVEDTHLGMRALLLAGRALAVRRGGDLGDEAGGDSVLLLPSRSRP